MANSGHFSAVTSVEVVSSNVVGGLRPEVPLLASEEGMEWYRNGVAHSVKLVCLIL